MGSQRVGHGLVTEQRQLMIETSFQNFFLGGCILSEFCLISVSVLSLMGGCKGVGFGRSENA